jgi:antitoxin (DNA-binding transcriptional repressor) of toxin-antitoxin stability system
MAAWHKCRPSIAEGHGIKNCSSAPLPPNEGPPQHVVTPYSAKRQRAFFDCVRCCVTVVCTPMTSKVKKEIVSVRQLRSDWARIKRRVARGEHVILTDNGKPIMQLVPLERPALSDVDLAKHWGQRLERAKEIMGGRSTGASGVLEERAVSKW